MPCTLSREILLVAPRKKVWETYRDRLPEIVKSMKSIDEIQEIKRIKENEGFRIKNKWIKNVEQVDDICVVGVRIN